MREFQDYYSILGVDRNATPEDIREAYRYKSLQTHPDRFSSEKHKKQAEMDFKKVKEAYDTLNDLRKRYNYDLDWEKAKKNMSPKG